MGKRLIREERITNSISDSSPRFVSTRLVSIPDSSNATFFEEIISHSHPALTSLFSTGPTGGKAGDSPREMDMTE